MVVTVVNFLIDTSNCGRHCGNGRGVQGTFYVHFESKDTLYATLLSYYVSRVDME